MPEPTTIVVGSRDLLLPLQSRPEVVGGSVHVLPPNDIRVVLETILSARPRYVVLEDEFYRSSLGTAMVERVFADPGFTTTEFLVISGNTVAPLQSPAQSPVSAAPDWRTRRVPRIRMRTGVDVQLEGTTAELVDLSTLGAQVVSPGPIKPNQRVRVTLQDRARMVATVAWVSFEMAKHKPTPQYRAGMEFANPDTEVLEQFCVAYATSDRVST